MADVAEIIEKGGCSKVRSEEKGGGSGHHHYY